MVSGAIGECLLFASSVLSQEFGWEEGLQNARFMSSAM